MALKLCASCGEMKVKHATERNGRGRWVYRDEKRRIWAGHDCPDCRTGASRCSTYTKAKLNKCGSCSAKTVNRYLCSSCHTIKKTSDYQFTEYCV